MSKTEAAKRFYSAIDEAIKTLKQPKGTGEQMLKQIQQSPGVKKEEIELRGLDKYLKEQPKITKEEVEKYLATKPAPQITTIEKSSVEPTFGIEEFRASSKSAARRVNELESLGFEVKPTDDGRSVMYRKPGDPDFGEWAEGRETIKKLRAYAVARGDQITQEELERLDAIDALIRDISPDFVGKRSDTLARSTPKFDRPELQTPGGTNYRERLLQITMPGRANKVYDQTFRRGHWAEDDILAHVRTTDRRGPNGEKILLVEEIQSDWHQLARKYRTKLINRQLELESKDLREQAIAELSASKPTADWPAITPRNEKILRDKINETIANRKKQLEKEIPVDIGYRTEADSAKLSELYDKLERVRNEGLTEAERAEYFTPGNIVEGYGGYDKVLSYKPGLKRNTPEYFEAVDNKAIQLMEKGYTPEEAGRIATSDVERQVGMWEVEVVEVNPKTGEPLKNARPRRHATSPEGAIRVQLQRQMSEIEEKIPDAPFKKTWSELAVKDILDTAAREGYDQVQFAPASTQIKRYNMSNFVDEIRVQKEPTGKFMVEGIANGQSIGAQSGISRENLADYIGKEQAEKFLQDFDQFGVSATTLSGPDLQLGSREAAGMRKFYDEMLPRSTSEYLKKEFGVEPLTLDKSSFESPMSADQIWDDLIAGPETAGLQDQAFNRARRQLALQRNTPLRDIPEDDQELQELAMDNFYELAEERARERQGAMQLVDRPTYAIPITPEMRSKITTQGQRLFAVPPAVGAGMLPQEETEPAADLRDQMQQEPDYFPPPVQQFKEAGKVEKKERTLSDSPFDESKRVQPKSLVSSAKDATRILTGEQQETKNIAAKRIGENVEAAQGTVEYLTDMLVPQTPSEVALEAAFGPVTRPIRKVLLGMAAAGYEPDAEAAKRQIFHGGSTLIDKFRKGEPLWVSTDPGYAAKRGADKMRTRTDVTGPPAVTKGTVETNDLLELQRQYSPQEVALAQKALSSLPANRSLSGEEIYEAAKGSGQSRHVQNLNMDRIARAMGKLGYEVPSGVSGAGDWYKILDQTEGVELAKKYGGKI